MKPIHIFSDLICPWCYLGKRRLDRALEQRYMERKPRPELVWHPHELDPDTPEEGEDRLERLAVRYGRDRVKAMDARLTELGRLEGVDFGHMSKVARIPNTFQAHRLLGYAQDHGKGHAVAEGLFQAHFLEGKDIGDRAVLLALGMRLDFPATELHEYLNGSEGGARIRLEEEEAQRAGLRGVPYYLIQDHPLYGAQEMGIFLKAMEAPLGVHA